MAGPPALIAGEYGGERNDAELADRNRSTGDADSQTATRLEPARDHGRTRGKAGTDGHQDPRGHVYVPELADERRADRSDAQDHDRECDHATRSPPIGEASR